MAYPTLYDVTYSYTGFQQAQGNNSFPGTQLDADLAGLEAGTESLATFVQGVMRSDGALNNGIVTFDSLSPALQTAGIAPATAWLTGVSYKVNATVAINGNVYRTPTAHTSGVFAVDLTAGKWVFVVTLVSTVQVTPEQFGAVGDGDVTRFSGTDDSPAWNAMLNYLRTQLTGTNGEFNIQVKGAINCRPGAIYRLNSTLNFTGFRSRNLNVYGNGAMLYPIGINNKPVVDAVWSIGIKWHDLVIYSENGATSGTLVQPSYGIVIGRKNTADDASENLFQNVRISGWYNRASFLNLSSELNMFVKCAFENSVSPTFVGSVFGGLALHVTMSNESSFTSDFQTMSTLPTYGMNEQLFLQCTFNSGQGECIRISGITSSVRFLQCYAAVASVGYSAVRLVGVHYNLELDMHVETANVLYNVLLDLSVNSTIYGFKLQDSQTQASHVIGVVGSTGAANIINGEIRLPSALFDTTQIFAPGTGINFNGKVYIGTAQAGLNKLSGSNSFRGEVYTEAAASVFDANLPGSGYAWVYSGVDSFPRLLGINGVTGYSVGTWRTGALGLRSSGAAFDMVQATSEALTADRTLNWVLGDASRTVTLGGNVVTAGAFTLAGAFGATFTFTGTTAVTFPTSGTLATVNGALGTPASGVATNLTGTAAGLTAGHAPLAGITGLGTGAGNALSNAINAAGGVVVQSGTLASGALVVGGGPAGSPATITNSAALALIQSGLTYSTVNVNFANANTDTAIPIVLPAGFTRFQIFRFAISHATASLTASTFGIFSAAVAGGVALQAAGTAPTVSSAADATPNNSQLTSGPVSTTFVSASLATPNVIYFRVGTAVAATADVTIEILPLP